MPYKDPEQKRAYQREWLKKRRRAWLEKNGPCVQCNESDLGELLVHHKDKSLKDDHKVWSWSAARREAELAKCEVRCIKCHADHHGLETPLPEHGTWQRYKSRRDPCKCDECSDANTEYEITRRSGGADRWHHGYKAARKLSNV